MEHRCQKSQEISEEWSMKDGDELENAGIDLNLTKEYSNGILYKETKNREENISTLLPKRIVKKVEEGSFKNMWTNKWMQFEKISFWYLKKISLS